MKTNALPATVNSIEIIAIDTLPVIEQDIVDSIRSCMDESKFSSLVDLYIAQAEEQSQQFQQMAIQSDRRNLSARPSARPASC